MTQESLTPDQAMAKAKLLLKKGDSAAAITLYQQVLASSPRHKKAKSALKSLQKTVSGKGNQPDLQAETTVLMQLYNAGQFDQALTQAKRLCHIFPSQPMPYNIAGVILANRGDKEGAIANYKQALSIAPGYIDGHNNLGSALHALGRYEDALACYTNVIRLNPRDADAYFNLGNVLHDADLLPDAVTSYQRSIDIRPLFTLAHCRLGDTLKSLGKTSQAIASYQNAIDIDPKLVDAYVNIAAVLQMEQLYDSAIAWYQDALTRQPDHLQAQRGLAWALLKAGKREEAIFTYQRCLELGQDAEGEHFLNAAQHIASEIAPRKYIEDLFDNYASNFEDNLTENLGYNAPETLKELVSQSSHFDASIDSAIDLGCGTGLSGLAFRDMCTSLTGVDLSNKMLAKATGKSIYDHLHTGDAKEVLNHLNSKFGLFICADMLVYIGNLAPLMKVIGEHSATDALLTLSTEHIDSGDFELRESGRYAHSKDYIVHTATTAGFELISFKEQNLRKEGPKWLSGGYYLFKYCCAPA